MKIFTAEQMRAFDREAIEAYQIPSIVLMENAALRVVEFLEAKFSPLGEKKIVILCGKGNNGGDGFAIARHLTNAGCRLMVAMAAAEDELKGDALTNFQVLCECSDVADLPLSYFGQGRIVLVQHLGRALELFLDADIVVDALLGTGFQIGLRKEPQFPLTVLSMAHGYKQVRVAVDVPSALNADTGEAASQAARADFTVTFAAPKRGMFVREGIERCGEIWVGDIGSGARQMDEARTDCELFTHASAQRMMPRRTRDAHKGDAGRVLVVGGSRGMSGAVAMASHASLQVGAGLCLAAVPNAILDTVAASVLEATTHPLVCDEKGTLTEAALEDLRSRWAEMQAVAIGPGTGRAASTWELVRSIVRECPVPLIIDADALHALPEMADEMKARTAGTILTPHPGEMGVLLGRSAREVQEDRFGAVEECAREYGAVAVLKGAYSLVAQVDGADIASTWVNPTGNAGMATGGAGDVLTGTIAGLLAQTRDALNATLLGVYLHGLAGDLAFVKHGNGLTARDIAAHLGAALLELDKPRGEEINGRLRRLV